MEWGGGDMSEALSAVFRWFHLREMGRQQPGTLGSGPWMSASATDGKEPGKEQVW